MTNSVVHFYQTGTFTVGNRLMGANERSLQASQDRPNSLTSGHRACQGCGEALGARYAVDAARRAVHNRLAAANATGCLEVFQRRILKLAGIFHGSIRFLAIRRPWRPAWRRRIASVLRRRVNL